MGTYLKYITHLGPLAAILLSALALVLWIPEFLAPNADLLALGLTSALVLLNGAALMIMFYVTNVTRYREPLAMVLYLWFITAFPELHLFWKLQLALFLFTPVVAFIQKTRLNPQSQELVFISTLLILFASFLFPVMGCLVLVLWLALVYQQSLSLRSLLASWVAIAVVMSYVLLSHFYWSMPMPWSWSDFRVDTAVSTWIEWAVLALMTIIMMAQILWRIHKENNHTRLVVVLAILIFFIGGVAMFIPLFGVSSLSLVLYVATWLAAIYFWQRDSIFRGVFFLLLLILCLVGNLV